MLTEKYFQDRYKAYSNAELIDIIDNPKGYELIALSAAKTELSSRNLSEVEFSEARDIFRYSRENANRQADRNEMIKRKLSDMGSELAENISPIQTPVPTVSKIIFLLATTFSLILFYQVWNNWNNYKYIIIGEAAEKFAYSVNLFPILLLLIGVVFFWLKKKIGWTIIIIYSAGSMVQFLFGSFLSLSYYFGPETKFSFFQQPTPSSFILLILIWIGLILTLIRKDIREVFLIRKKDEITGPMVAGLLIGIVLIMLSS